MSKTTNKYSPEVHERAVRMVLSNENQHESRWSAILSISAKIGCAPQTLNEWVKKAEVDSGRAWITGIHQHMLDPDDPWPEGYRLTDTWPNYGSSL